MKLTPSILTVALATVAAPVAEAGQYKLVTIEPSGGSTFATTGCSDVNDLGLVVGRTVVGGVGMHFEWTVDGGFQFPTHLPPDGTRRVNDFGDSVFYPGGVAGLLLADGTLVPISDPLPGGGEVACRDLNDALVVAGHGATTGTSSHCFEWNPVDGSQPVLVPNAWFLWRVNSGTLAVGSRRISDVDEKGFLVDLATGAWVDFAALLPAQGSSQAVDVNDSGQVVGVGPDGTSLSAFVWDAGNGFRFLPGLKGGFTQYVRPAAIDNSGRVVGSALTGDGENRAFLWDPQLGMFDLNDLVEGAGDFLLVEAKDVSETGVVIGYGFHGATWGPDRGFILVPRLPSSSPARTLR